MKLFQLLFLCLFLNFSSSVSAQVYRFKTSNVSVIEKDAKGKWGNWSDAKKAALITTLDTKKNRIQINSRDLQLFTILNYGEETENESDRIVPFECQDNSGTPCTLLIMTRKNQGNRMQLYINYRNIRYVYNISNITKP